MKRWPLIAMENILFADHSLGWPDRCATIAAAGYDGIYAVSYPLSDNDFPRLRQLDREPRRHGLSVSAVYTNLDLAQSSKHETNQRLNRLFEEVEGTPRIELSIKCSKPACMPENIDEAILRRLEPLLAIAERRGIQVALYPHSFYPLETPDHAARLVKRLGHPSLAYLFATSHVYAVSEPAGVVAQLAACMSEIASFNVCGCRRLSPGVRARCGHFPLDEGDLSLDDLFLLLAEGGYGGEVIVQGQGWTGDLPAMLSRCVSFFKNPQNKFCDYDSN